MISNEDISSISIRKATAIDIEQVAQIHFEAYFTRFFDDHALNLNGVPYGAPLAKEHPCLAIGQDRVYFGKYWKKFSNSLWTEHSDTNICFVATLEGAVIAFAKGSAGPAAQENFDMITAPPKGNIGELGSIYVDPTKKLHGCGQRLVAEYARELQTRGYDQMVTSAYYKNDSPHFFARLGSKVIGSCDIPNEYIDYSEPHKPIKIQNIGGTLMHWEKEPFASLCGMHLPINPELKVAPAMRPLEGGNSRLTGGGNLAFGS